MFGRRNSTQVASVMKSRIPARISTKWRPQNWVLVMTLALMTMCILPVFGSGDFDEETQKLLQKEKEMLDRLKVKEVDRKYLYSGFQSGRRVTVARMADMECMFGKDTVKFNGQKGEIVEWMKTESEEQTKRLKKITLVWLVRLDNGGEENLFLEENLRLEPKPPQKTKSCEDTMTETCDTILKYAPYCVGWTVFCPFLTLASLFCEGSNCCPESGDSGTKFQEGSSVTNNAAIELYGKAAAARGYGSGAIRLLKETGRAFVELNYKKYAIIDKSDIILNKWQVTESSGC